MLDPEPLERLSNSLIQSIQRNYLDLYNISEETDLSFLQEEEKEVRLAASKALFFTVDLLRDSWDWVSDAMERDGT